jgi:dynein heavy chain
VFAQTQEYVKKMNKSLELMNDLHSDEMQERHWTLLSNETNSKVNPDDPNFCFKDL